MTVLILGQKEKHIMKKILIVSHCILNNASKVAQDESELKQEYETRDKLLRLALNKNIQLLQLPCPEFIMYGSRRFGHVKDQFMHPHFRRESLKMLKPVIDQIEEYSSYPEDFTLVGIVSVEGSPSCGRHLTYRADWRGEIAADLTEPVMAEEPGVYMEVLAGELERRGLGVPVLTMEETIGILEKL